MIDSLPAAAHHKQGERVRGTYLNRQQRVFFSPSLFFNFAAKPAQVEIGADVAGSRRRGGGSRFWRWNL